MRALIITTSLPYPPTSGGAIRVHGIVEGLHRAGHDLTIFCFDDGQGHNAEATAHLRVETVPAPTRTILDRLHTLLLTHQPDIARRFYSDAFADRLRALLAEIQYDLIQFEGIEMVCYLPIVKNAQPNAKLCFDTFNAEYALQRNIYEIDRRNINRLPHAVYSLIQTRRIADFEQQMCELADCVFAVSQEDAGLLRHFRPDGRIAVVPNGIWVERYIQKEVKPAFTGEQTLVFTGKMDYRPNVDAMLWFTDEIFPLIKARIPDAHLYIVGQQPHPRFKHLYARDDVTITGWVESVLPHLHPVGVYVAPLRMGSGTRLKLLEAMAAQCAIVATTTASAGMNTEVRQAMLIADDASSFADAVITLLENPSQREQMKRSARELVRQHYDWSVLIPRLLEAYKEIGVG